MPFLRVVKLNHCLDELTGMRETQTYPAVEYYHQLKKFLLKYDNLNLEEKQEFWKYLEAIK